MSEKYISAFVNKMKFLDSKKQNKPLWLSKPENNKPGLTYNNKKHGELK